MKSILLPPTILILCMIFFGVIRFLMLPTTEPAFERRTEYTCGVGQWAGWMKITEVVRIRHTDTEMAGVSYIKDDACVILPDTR